LAEDIGENLPGGTEYKSVCEVAVISEIKLRLNLRNKTDESAKERVAEAVAKKKAANETIDEAWQRILEMKNSDTDRQRLSEVKEAMISGALGRHPADVAKRFSKAEAMRLWSQLQENSKADKLRELVEKTPANYKLITTVDQFETLLGDLSNETIIAIDTETTGLDVYGIDEIVGMSVTLPNADYHVYIPVKHNDCEQLDREYVLYMLRPVLENEFIGKVLHNSKFDIHMFLRHGIRMRGIKWDTLVGMHLLNENEDSFALKNLATKYLNKPSDTYSTLFGKKGFNEITDLQVALAYGAKDTDVCWRLYQFQMAHLRKMPTVLEYGQNIEIPLIEAIIDMERTGFDIDVDYAKTYGEEMKQQIDDKERFLIDKLGGINLNSPAQLKPALESVIGKKLESTDAKKVLKPLSKEFPVIAELLEYKELVKLFSTYISVLPELIHPITGKLHAQFNQNGARTGRFSSGGNGVNLQNQPKSARKLFVAPDGWLIMGGDWSQQEVRCAAYLTQEPVLLEAYENGRDVYASMASEVYGKPYEQCGDGTPERKAMKFGVLSALYGTGPSTLAGQLGISNEDAKAFLTEFFDRLPGVKKWIEETQEFAKKNGFVWMDKQQRKRRLPDAKKRTRNYDPDVSRALRQGPNAVVQGTSAIQTKTTLIELQKLCNRKGWKLWATCHDEALLLVPETITREDVAEFEQVMVESYKFGNVRNKTDIELMARWGNGVSVKEWFNQ
jgi:DNA polymerase-1